jgi:hypothetical protein
MGRSARDLGPRRGPAPGARQTGPHDPDVELVERLFTGGPDA